MFWGYTDKTQPLQLSGLDGLDGFSGGGYSSSGDIFDAVFDDASKNNSLYGLQEEFRKIFEQNQEKVFESSGERIQGFDTLRYRDVAESLAAGEKLGVEEQEGYTLDLDMVNERFKKLKETNPEIQTFEEMYDLLKANAKAAEIQVADVTNRSTNFGSVVGFVSGLVSAFNSNDPLNIASLPIGGVGKTAALRILSEMGVGGATEAINQFLGVRRNRELLGLKTSTWQSVQQILFAAGGAGAFRGIGEAAPAVGRAIEQRVDPERALGREMLRQLEEAGVPIQSEEFLKGVVFPTETKGLRPDEQYSGGSRSATLRAGEDLLEQERLFSNSNFLGRTQEGIDEHHARAESAAEEYRAGIEAQSNGLEPARSGIFDDVPLRGVTEKRGVPVEEVNRILDESSAEIDVEITSKRDQVQLLESDVANFKIKSEGAKVKPLSDFLPQSSPEKAKRLLDIETQKDRSDITKGMRKKLAVEERAIVQSPEGKRAKELRKGEANAAGANAILRQQELKLEKQNLRNLEQKRTRIRDKANKEIDTRPKKILTPIEDRARNEKVRLQDGAPLRVSGIGERGGDSPSDHVKLTVERLEKSDPNLNRQLNETVARIERSFSEADGKFDIGLPDRVSGDTKVMFDDGDKFSSINLKDMLADIKEQEKVLAAMKECAL